MILIGGYYIHQVEIQIILTCFIIFVFLKLLIKLKKKVTSMQISTSSEILFNLIKVKSLKNHKVELIKKKDEKRKFYTDFVKSFFFNFIYFSLFVFLLKKGK